MNQNGQMPTRDTDQQKMVKKIKHYIYDPNEVIGSGFSSNVFKGINEMNNETIAIKVLQLSKIQNQVEKYLLNNEINALRTLNHENVLRTIEILMTKNNVYIMTEFCENGDLQQFVKKQTKLNELEALCIVRDVIEGYSAIEEKKIIHRDLKTANIFLSNKGARIADFGFCEFLGELKKPQISYNVGSPAYMSPESYKQNIYSNKSDIWSIGIILYEMLLGQTPDKNLTYTEMVTNLMNGKIYIGNEEIKRILTLCFKKQLKERICCADLYDMVNTEIQRLQKMKNRPQTAMIQPQPSTSLFNINQNQNNLNVMASKPILSGIQPVSPSQNNRNNYPKPMITSMLPLNNQVQPKQEPLGQQQSTFNHRNPSPFKIFPKEELKQSIDSPFKMIEARFSHNKDEIKPNSKQELPPPLFQQNLHQNQSFPSNRYKPYIQTLLFLYRLLNFISQSHMDKMTNLKLLLFRHRSFLEMICDRMVSEENVDRNFCEPYKEFQFLKTRFDETYLHKEGSNKGIQQPNHQVMKAMNELANMPFTDTRSLEFYSSLVLDNCSECDHYTTNTPIELPECQKVCLIWDYLMIEYEMIEMLYSGVPTEAIAGQKLHLETIMKEQPKKVFGVHHQLLKAKSKWIAENPIAASRNSHDFEGREEERRFVPALF